MKHFGRSVKKMEHGACTIDMRKGQIFFKAYILDAKGNTISWTPMCITPEEAEEKAINIIEEKRIEK